MMISTKGRYALRFLVDVAEHQGDGFVPLKDIAVRQEISEKYLEIIVKELVKGGLLTAMRGKGGGYRLKRTPEEYNVKDIIELMEGPLVPVACLEPGRLDFLPPEQGMPDAPPLAGVGQSNCLLFGSGYPHKPDSKIGRAPSSILPRSSLQKLTVW